MRTEDALIKLWKWIYHRMEMNEYLNQKSPRNHSSWIDWFRSEIGFEVEQTVQKAKITRNGNHRKIPSYDILIEFCKENNDKESCHKILKFTNNLPEHELTGGGWQPILKHCLSVLRDFCDEQYIDEFTR